MTTLLLFAASAALTTLPYTYAGRLVNWNHQAYGDGSEVTVRALNAAGETLAKTTTFGADDGTVNYRLAVPLATAKTSGYAQAGERIVLQVETRNASGETEDFSSKIAEGYRTVGAPGTGARLDLVLATDTNGNGVPDEYEDYYTYQMDGEYDPNADFDGDGLSNYAEYVAGTSPIDRRDCFRVKQLASGTEETGEYLAFVFMASAGRSYTVSGKTDLAKPGEWTMLRFRTEANGADRERITLGDNPETKTLYVPVDRSQPSGFFRLNAE